MNRDELRDLIEHWPEIDDFQSGSSAQLAINNCLNEICHGIAFYNNDWSTWFKVNREEILAVYKRWAESVGLKRTGVM